MGTVARLDFSPDLERAELQRTTSDLFLVGVREFRSLKVAFIAPREGSHT